MKYLSHKNIYQYYLNKSLNKSILFFFKILFLYNEPINGQMLLKKGENEVYNLIKLILKI